MIWGVTCCILTAFIFCCVNLHYCLYGTCGRAIPISFPKQVPQETWFHLTAGRFPTSSATAPLWATLPLRMVSMTTVPPSWQKHTGKGALRCVPVASKSGYMQMRPRWGLEVVATKKVTQGQSVLQILIHCKMWQNNAKYTRLVRWIFFCGELPIVKTIAFDIKCKIGQPIPLFKAFPEIKMLVATSRPCYTTCLEQNLRFWFLGRSGCWTMLNQFHLSDFLEALGDFVCYTWWVHYWIFMPIVFKQDLNCQDDQDVIVQNHHSFHGYGYANPPKKKWNNSPNDTLLSNTW